MEEQIYKIIRIDEDDFGCEGRQEGQEPMVRVVLEADTGETMIVMMEDALMYTRKLDVNRRCRWFVVCTGGGYVDGRSA